MSHGKHRFLEEARKSVTLNVVGVCLNRIGTIPPIGGHNMKGDNNDEKAARVWGRVLNCAGVWSGHEL